MGKVISTINPKDSWTIKNKCFDGFVLSVNLKSVAAGFSTALHNLDKLTLKATLKRNGSNKVLFNENLRDMLALSHLHAPTYEFVKNPFMFVPTSNAFVNPVFALIPLRFWIGGVIDLSGKNAGEVILEWSLGNDFFGTTVDTSASTINIDVIETDAAEYETPITLSHLIEPNQPTPTFGLGDNVREIALFNHDKQTILTADQVLEEIVISSSNGYNRADKFDELLTKSINQYSDVADAFVRKQNFIVYKDNNDLDDCQVELKFNKANLTAGNNILLFRTFITNDWLRTRAAIKDAKRSATDRAKGDFSPAIAKEIH